MMKQTEKTSLKKYEEMKHVFEASFDKQKAGSMAAYMRNRFCFYGIPASQRKQLYKQFLKEEKKKKAIDWTFLELCCQDEHREFQYLFCDYLAAMKHLLVYEDLERIKDCISANPWWDTIDSIDALIGEIGTRDERVDELMLQWAVSDSIWLRRIAIDHQLDRKEKTNTALLGRIITANLGSKEFFIKKAIGWSLREYSKTNPKWVQSFLKVYERQMDPLSIREASKYL